MERSINDVARLTGTTSRTLRHYDSIGVLKPSSVGSNGYRYYDDDALTRLQRILLLRELGLGLPAISAVLEGQAPHEAALRTHLQWLHREKERLDRQIVAVERTITKIEKKEPLVAEEMFDGFDHSQYKEEVEERWGEDAYAKSDAWWRSQTAEQKARWKTIARQLGEDWISAFEAGVDPESDEAQTLAQRQFEWLRSIPGTPGGEAGGPTKEYFTGLGEMYVADPRFAANYGGQAGAEFVRDAMSAYAQRNLTR